MRHDYDKQTDRQIILGPIYKYAAIGITIGIVFITGTVTLEHRVNHFEKDVSELKAQLAREDKAEQSSASMVDEQQTRIQNDAKAAEPPKKTALSTTESDTEMAAVVEDTATDNRDAPVNGASENDGSIQEMATSVNDRENPVIAAPLVDAEQQPPGNIVTASPVTEPPLATIPLSEQRSDAAADSAYERTEAASSMDMLEHERLDHLSYLEWLEQQRLRRHELWLENIEQRHRDDFGTRKASNPDYDLHVLQSNRENI
jgi:hypothetical protein